MLQAPVEPPISHLGPYRLLRPLGQGGFAPVWLAEEAYHGSKLRDVAIKLFTLPQRRIVAPGGASRWRQEIVNEARALCRVEHPNVVRFYALHQDDERDIIGLVMEHVAGKSLDVLAREEGPLEERRILDVGISVAWALAAVHDAGLVHRDVKPGNIIQGGSGYKLIDFGIVVEVPQAASEAEGDHAPQVAGTPGYIALECFEPGARPTPGSDLYALGVTLFRLVFGYVPGPELSVAQGVTSPPSSLAPIGADARSLEELIALLRHPDPGVRPRHADWVARELEQIRARVTTELHKDTLAPSKSRAVEARVLALEAGSPVPLAPFFAAIRRARRNESAQRALADLGVGVLRYAFAVGMAMLAERGSHALSGALAEQLRSAARPTPASWCALVRALHDALSEVDPARACFLAFAGDPALPERLGALSGKAPDTAARGERASVSTDEGAQWIAHLHERAAALLALRICFPAAEMPTAAQSDADVGEGAAPAEEPYVLLDDRPVYLPPWLPYEGGRLLLPEVPAAPDKPWRAADPASGERREDARLDHAVREMIPEEEETLRELCADPPLVGRGAALSQILRAAREAAQGRARVALITGPLGIGRTRLLEATIEQAGVSAERVLSARCSPERRGPWRPLLRGVAALGGAGGGAFAMVIDAIERAVGPTVLPGPQRSDEAIEGVLEALLSAAAEGPVLFAIDDIQWADAQTVALLARLVDRAERGSRARLFVIATARDEPNPSIPLRDLRGAVHGLAEGAVRHVALGPLSPPETRDLVQSVGPLDPAIEQAVVRGSGGVPFFVLHALTVWRGRGALVMHRGVFRAADPRILADDVPGVAELIEDRLASCFEPASPLWRAARAALAVIALYGGGLPLDVILRAASADAEGVKMALPALMHAGILAPSGEREGYGFAQEMVRQAVLNLLRPRPWFFRLHRSLLDVIAEGKAADADAAFLAAGYEKLGARDEARAWLARAMAGAISAGLFAEAVTFGERLSALTADPEARLGVELSVVRALVRGRLFEEAKAHLERTSPRALGRSVTNTRAASQDITRRIRRLEVARGLTEAADDPTLVADADALSDPVLGCEARIALAGVLPKERAMEVASEAVALSQRCGPALEFAARVLRVELCHAAGPGALTQAERDLERALALAVETGSIWQQLHIEGDLAVLSAELGRVGAAIERLFRLVEQAHVRGMRGQERLLSHNLSICLMRDGRAKEAARAAQQTADLAAEAGDPRLRAVALSLRAYALWHTGDLDAALACASEAERLQRERGDHQMRMHTLLRRAEILGALSRSDEAMADAREARRVAEQHGDDGIAVTAKLWVELHLARRGEASREALGRALADAERAGVGRRALAQRLMEQAAAWLAGAS